MAFWPVASPNFVLVVTVREDPAFANLICHVDTESRFFRNVGTKILILRIMRQGYVPHGFIAEAVINHSDHPNCTWLTLLYYVQMSAWWLPSTSSAIFFLHAL